MEDEIVLGIDDSRLSLRQSIVLRPSSTGEPYLTVVTTSVVFAPTLIGKAYLRAITPFHDRVTRSNLNQLG